ncbi:MAG: ABC transporter permease, partial [Candidatus Humimicrobiaceae bacterium]
PTIGLGWELTVIACVIVGGISLLGGAGTMMGTLIGVIIILSVQNGLVITGVSTYWQTLAIGLIMIGAVYIDMVRRQRQLFA